jgi:hypothetical protein
MSVGITSYSQVVGLQPPMSVASSLSVGHVRNDRVDCTSGADESMGILDGLKPARMADILSSKYLAYMFRQMGGCCF